MGVLHAWCTSLACSSGTRFTATLRWLHSLASPEALNRSAAQADGEGVKLACSSGSALIKLFTLARPRRRQVTAEALRPFGPVKWSSRQREPPPQTPIRPIAGLRLPGHWMHEPATPTLAIQQCNLATPGNLTTNSRSAETLQINQ